MCVCVALGFKYHRASRLVMYCTRRRRSLILFICQSITINPRRRGRLLIAHTFTCPMPPPQSLVTWYLASRPHSWPPALEMSQRWEAPRSVLAVARLKRRPSRWWFQALSGVVVVVFQPPASYLPSSWLPDGARQRESHLLMGASLSALSPDADREIHLSGIQSVPESRAQNSCSLVDKEPF